MNADFLDFYRRNLRHLRIKNVLFVKRIIPEKFLALFNNFPAPFIAFSVLTGVHSYHT